MRGQGEGDPLVSISLPFLTFISMLFWPTLIDRVRSETKERLVVMLQIQGTSMVAYWAATYLFHLTLYFLFVCGGFLGFQLLLGNSAFSDGAVLQLLLVLTVWGHAQIGMGVLLSALLQRTMMVSAIAWQVLFHTQLLLRSTSTLDFLNKLMRMIITLLSVFSIAIYSFIETWSTWLIIFAPTNFIRAVTLAMEGGAQTSTIVECIGTQFASGLVAFFLGALVHYSRMQGDAGRSILGELRHLLVSVLKAASHDPIADRIALASEAWLRSCVPQQGRASKSPTTLLGLQPHNCDDDVKAEEARTRNLASGTDAAIRLLDLCKVFPGRGKAPAKVAVKGVTMAIDYDECFGLLGPNGAGKTTTINMLCGFLAHSGGNATIGGFGLDDIRRVRSVLGVCPQFDTVWPSLTVQEHLLLYARLKGTSHRQENAKVQRVAELVSLDGDAFTRAASNLSGGMRRRLSIGIALVGNPRCVFLDEPTTGLDPDTRQAVWKIMKLAQPGRAIILTTHSMEEADALSSRIGIMANGSLRCIGTQLHLKNRYGTGYRLKVHPKPGIAAETIDTFVLNTLCAGAELVQSESAASMRIFSIPQADIKVSVVFELMEKNKDGLGIQEWSLNQTSLEEVFMRIARAAEEEASHAATE